MGTAIGAALVYESFTSTFQSWVFARLNDRISFEVTSGSGPDTVYPKHGPYDRRLGYTHSQEFRGRLKARGYEVNECDLQSPALEELLALGIV